MPFTLLHGGMVDENATAVQQFIDSEPGNNVGVFFHTIGAAFFIGAALVLMLWAWSNRRGFVDPNRYHVVATQWILLAGMGMNGLGGLIRLQQSDHPGLDQLGTNPWVDYIFYKHIGLIAANLLALGLLVWYVPKRHRVLWWPPAGLFRRKEPPQPDGGEPEANKPMRGVVAASAAAFIVFASLVAGVLGAAATTIGPGTEEESDVGSFSVTETPSPPIVTWANDTGSLRSNVLIPASNDHPAVVPEGALRLVATARWTNPASALTVGLFSPDGQPAGPAAEAAPGATSATATAEGPLGGGEWRVQVGGRAADESYQLEVRIESAALPRTVIDGTAVIPPGAFAEFNLNMTEGASFEFFWETIGGAELDFNVHWHEGETVHEQHVMTTCCADTGTTYTAEVPTIHSPEWRNRGETTVTVGFVISGTFKFHSAAAS